MKDWNKPDMSINRDFINYDTSTEFNTKHPYNQSYVFSSSHVQLWKLDIKKTEGHRTDAFELRCWSRLLRVPQTARRSNQSILKEINPEYSLEGLMLKLKFQYFGHLIQKSRFIGKDPDAGKDWGQEEKEATEDEMVGWHNWLNGRESEWTPGDGDGQGGLACCDSWGHKESDMTERLNWTELKNHCRWWLQPWN